MKPGYLNLLRFCCKSDLSLYDFEAIFVAFASVWKYGLFSFVKGVFGCCNKKECKFGEFYNRKLSALSLNPPLLSGNGESGDSLVDHMLILERPFPGREITLFPWNKILVDKSYDTVSNYTATLKGLRERLKTEKEFLHHFTLEDLFFIYGSLIALRISRGDSYSGDIIAFDHVTVAKCLSVLFPLVPLCFTTDFWTRRVRKELGASSENWYSEKDLFRF